MSASKKPVEFSIEDYSKLKDTASKKKYIETSASVLSFEELFELWWWTSRRIYTDYTLKVRSLEILLQRAKDSPKNILFLATHTTRGDVRGKAIKMLLEHFDEPNKSAVKGFTFIEVITVAIFLRNKGEIPNK